MTVRLVAAGLLAAFTAACSSSAGVASADINQAVQGCGISDSKWVSTDSIPLKEGGSGQYATLYINDGTRGNGVTLDATTCLLKALGAPDDVQTRIFSSEADSPDSKESWGDVGLTYSRPANGGLDISIYSPASTGG